MAGKVGEEGSRPFTSSLNVTGVYCDLGLLLGQEGRAGTSGSCDLTAQSQ